MATKVLSYGDILLRQQDVDLLHGRHWLNDQLMSFYFAYLEKEKYNNGTTAYCGGSLTYLLSHVGRHLGPYCIETGLPFRAGLK